MKSVIQRFRRGAKSQSKHGRHRRSKHLPSDCSSESASDYSASSSFSSSSSSIEKQRRSSLFTSKKGKRHRRATQEQGDWSSYSSSEDRHHRRKNASKHPNRHDRNHHRKSSSSAHHTSNEPLTREELFEMPARKLRQKCHSLGLDTRMAVEKADLVSLLHEYYRQGMNSATLNHSNIHSRLPMNSHGIGTTGVAIGGHNNNMMLLDETEQMIEILQEIIPFYGQGDSAVDSIVKETLERVGGYSLETRTPLEGNTILMQCCQYSTSLALVPLLLAKGCDVNAQNSYGETCLHFACYTETFSPDTVKVLIDRGANAEVSETRFGCTPLHWSASRGDVNVCKMLCSAGAKPTTIDKNGCDPIAYAKQSQAQDCVEYLTSIAPQGDCKDWVKMIDGPSGRTYYHDEQSGQSLWNEEFIQMQLMTRTKPKDEKPKRPPPSSQAPATAPAPVSTTTSASTSSPAPMKVENLESVNALMDIADATISDSSSEVSDMQSKDSDVDEPNAHVQPKKSTSHTRDIDLADLLSDCSSTSSKKDCAKKTTGQLQVVSLDECNNHDENHMASMERPLKQEKNAKAEAMSLDCELSAKLGAAQRQLASLEESNSHYKSQISSLERTLQDEKNAKADAMSSHCELSAKLGTAQSHLSSMEESNSRYKSQISSMERTLEEEKNAKDEAMSLQRELSAKLDTAQSELASLGESNSHYKSQISSMERFLEYEKNAKAEAMSLLEVRASEVTFQLKKDLDEINRQKHEVMESYDSVKRQLAENEMKLQQMIDTVKKTEIERNEAMKSYESATRRIADTEMKLQQMTDTMKEKEVERNEAVKSYESALKRTADTEMKLQQMTDVVKKTEVERNEAVESYERALKRTADSEMKLQQMIDVVKEAKVLVSVNERLHRSLHNETEKRKSLHNKLEDLKGRIRVYVRIRPLSETELSRKCDEALTKEDKRTCIMSQEDQRKAIKSWEFDQVFCGSSHSGNSQEEIFKDTRLLVTSAIDGFNVCIFAYGQTGSGKTYTMFGSGGEIPVLENGEMNDEAGLAPRVAMELFHLLEEKEASCDISVTVNMFELYNDNIQDLMASGDNQAQLKIKLAEHSTTGLVSVEGAVTETVSNAVELLDLFRRGSHQRTTASTKMNADSSRSHLITSMVTKLVNKRSGRIISGKLTLVDLAGSERLSKSGATGHQMKEAQSINKSLSALGDVINALTSGSKHIPYRNHPLTMLMSDSLGGNAKTLMFVCCSPADYNRSETSNSLDFAKRCKDVTNNVNGSAAHSAQIKTLKAELSRLKKANGGSFRKRPVVNRPGGFS